MVGIVKGPPDPRGLPFGPGHQGPVSAGLSAKAEAPWFRGFPWAFAPAAFASRVFLLPQRSSASVAVGLPERIRPGPLRGLPVPLAPDATWEDAPFTPGPVVVTQQKNTDLRCHLEPSNSGPFRRLPAIDAVNFYEASSGVHLRSSFRSSPCPVAGDGPPALGASRQAAQHETVTSHAPALGDPPTTTTERGIAVTSRAIHWLQATFRPHGAGSCGTRPARSSRRDARPRGCGRGRWWPATTPREAASRPGGCRPRR